MERTKIVPNWQLKRKGKDQQSVKLAKSKKNHSGTERILKGRTLPGEEFRGEITEIIKRGSTREVKFADGSVRRVTKPGLAKRFNEALQQRGMAAAMKSIKVDQATGKATAIIDAARKKPGIEKEYESAKRAQTAIKRYYKQPK